MMIEYYYGGLVGIWMIVVNIGEEVNMIEEMYEFYFF